VLFVIAFLARDVRLGTFSWPDEVTWTARSIAYYAGWSRAIWCDYQSDHPGVVPMWGYGGLLSLRALLRGDLAELYTMTTERQAAGYPRPAGDGSLWTVSESPL